MADQVRVRVSGEDAGVTALLRTLSRQLSSMEREQGRVAASTRVAAAAQRRASTDARAWASAQQAGASAAAGLTRRLVALAVAYNGIRTVLRGISRGLEVNAALESAELGIAALITAQGGLRDSTGRVLETTEALNAAQGLAADQLRQLRIAGLQTTATFEQLAQAFQTGVGPGLAAGLSLDEIRAVTVSLTQAAGAMNVPMQQLDQEVRSILEGSIDVNSRVARTLQITNAQVKLERERGTLAEFLLQRLEAFNASGERAQTTWQGLRSSMQEAFEVFAGDSTEPLFQRLRTAMNDLLSRAFDMDRGEIAPAFQGIVALARDMFDGLGALLARAMNAAVSGAERLSRWVEQNRTSIADFADEVGGAAGAMFRVVVEAGKLFGAIMAARSESGLLSAELSIIEGVARTVAGALQLVRENLTATVAILSGAALAAGIAKLTALGVFASGGIATALGLAGVAVASAPFTAAAVAITGVVVGLNALEAAQEKARAATIRANAAQTQAVREAPALIAEYRKLAEQIESGALKGDDLREAHDRVKEIKDDLLALSPTFRQALADETGSLTEQADEAKRLADELARTREEKIRDAEATLRRLEAQERQLAAVQGGTLDVGAGGATSFSAVASAELQKVRDDIAQTRAELTALGVDLDKPFQLAPQVVTSVESPPKVDPPKPTGTPAAYQELKRLTDAAVKEQARLLTAARADLDRQLELNLLSWDQYFGRVEAAAVVTFDAQRAALERLLAATTDAGDRARIEGDLAELERARTELFAENARRREDLERNLTREIRDLQTEQLRAQGQTVEARRRELIASFADLRQRLVLENRQEAVAIIDSLIDIGTARARIDQIEAAFSQATDARRLAEESVQTRVEAGIISERQAREELLAIYTRQRDAIAALVPALEAQAAATGAATDLQLVARYQNELARLHLLIEQTGDAWRQVREEALDSLTSDLSNFFARGVDEARTGAEAVIRLAQSVVQSLRQIASEALSHEIVDGVRGLFRGGGGNLEGAAAQTQTAAVALGAAGGAVTLAGDRIVTGAASLAGAAGLVMAAALALNAASANIATAATVSASMSALASAGIPGFAGGGYTGHGPRSAVAGVVHRGEYVIPAARVREIGIDRLDALAGLHTPTIRRPRRGPLPGYASGGYVTGGGGGSIDGRLEVGLAPGLVAGEMNAFFRTPAGEATVLRVIARNPQVLRGLIG